MTGPHHTLALTLPPSALSPWPPLCTLSSNLFRKFGAFAAVESVVPAPLVAGVAVVALVKAVALDAAVVLVAVVALVPVVAPVAAVGVVAAEVSAEAASEAIGLLLTTTCSSVESKLLNNPCVEDEVELEVPDVDSVLESVVASFCTLFLWPCL
jgi:hypothetical protein